MTIVIQLKAGSRETHWRVKGIEVRGIVTTIFHEDTGDSSINTELIARIEFK